MEVSLGNMARPGPRNNKEPGMIPALWRLRKEDYCEFQGNLANTMNSGSLSYIVSYLKNKTKQKNP